MPMSLSSCINMTNIMVLRVFRILFGICLVFSTYKWETGKVRGICSQRAAGAEEGELSPKSLLGSAVAN